MFRARLDAFTASTLFEELYDQKDSMDVYKLLGHFNSSGSDLNEWTVKHDAVQSMCENIATRLKQYMPQDFDQALLDQIEELRRQNAELTAQCKSQTATPPNPPMDKSCTAVVEVVRLALSRMGLQLVFALFYRMFGHHLQGMLRFRISLR